MRTSSARALARRLHEVLVGNGHGHRTVVRVTANSAEGARAFVQAKRRAVAARKTSR